METSSSSILENTNKIEIEKTNNINNTENNIINSSCNTDNMQEKNKKTDLNQSTDCIVKATSNDNENFQESSHISGNLLCNVLPAMPLQQLQNLDSIFSLGGQEFFLNNCGTKRLVIGVTSSGIPNLRIVFRLHDLKNGWHIEFNKKTWDTIVRHESLVIDYINNGIEDDIFDNNYIRVETKFFYDKCCVQFFDITETNITIAPKTYEHLMSLKNEIENVYTELNKKISDVTNRMKLFMDLVFFQLFKSNNIDSRHNYNWAMLQIDGSQNFMDLNNSIANTWEQLGKWISNESKPAASDSS